MTDGMTDNRSQPDREVSDLPVLARRLAMLRAARRQSLQEVADSVGLSKTHVWQLETGAADNPGLKVLPALSRHFGVPASYFAGEDEAPTLDLSPDQKAKLANLAAMRDDEIDTSDIPETSFAGAERGKFYRGNDHPRPLDRARLEALRLAAANGGNHEVIVAAAKAFLAFLDPGSAETITGPHKVEITVEGLEPQAEELPPYLSAQVGDVVEVIIGDDVRCLPVAGISSDPMMRLRLWYDHASRILVRNDDVKRIVRKASEAAS